MHRTPRHSTKPRARIQVLRCAEEILKRRAQGESFTCIHGDLVERTEIDISLRAFTLWVGRLEGGALFNAALRTPATQTVPTGEAARGNHDRSHGRDAQRRSAIQRNDRSSESNAPNTPREPKFARLGVPILPAPNSEPDCEALFGEKE